ncbi:MAG: hypothetical protein NC347_05810 [Clostridium sp.]|nr:hypothetical protein [Clostridium sp.]
MTSYIEDNKGFGVMSQIVEDMINEEVKEIAIRMLERGKLSIEEIAMCVGLSVEEVKALSQI